MSERSEQIERMIESGMSWSAIGNALGVRIIRRFTPEDDQFIRDEWIKNTHIRDIAAALGRSEGVVRQRIFHHLDLPKRDTQKTKIAARFGPEALALGQTADEIRRRLEDARLAAKAAATAAKLARREQSLDRMTAAITAGGDRNQAIFECRAEGVELEKIAERVGGITRERVRQICFRVATNRALAAAFGNGAAE